MCSLLAGRLDGEDRRQESEDEQHREGDHRPDPNGGEGDLAHRCVHVGETPRCGFVFRGFGRETGIFVRVIGRTRGWS